MIHIENDASSVDQLVLLEQHQSDAHGGAPAGGRVVVVFLRERPAGVRATAFSRTGRRFVEGSNHIRHGSPSTRVWWRLTVGSIHGYVVDVFRIRTVVSSVAISRQGIRGLEHGD